MIVYQIFTRLFGNCNPTRIRWGAIAENGCGKFNDISPGVLRQIRAMGVSHVWFTGVLRHASQTDYSAYGIPAQHAEIVKGKAGSPYAIADYYDVDPDLAVDTKARMSEWLSLISRTHKAKLKVIMDFVPNHVAREYNSICTPPGTRMLGEGDDATACFSPHNNFYYYPEPLSLPFLGQQEYVENPAKATGNDQFSSRPLVSDWYETVKLNYGVDYCNGHGRQNCFEPMPDTWKQMTDILLFWASKGIDGFRCDMAEMVPAEFWKYATGVVKQHYPHIIFIGEVYNPELYRTYIASGFDYLYDKVGMYDCLRGVVEGHRPASDITHQWQRTDDIRENMLYFLENHDEQRIASDFFAGNPWKGYPAHIVSCLLGTNPYMLYAGQEVGEPGMDEEGFSGKDGRTTIFDYWSLDSLAHEYYDKAHSTKEEKCLLEAYKKVMLIAEGEKAITQGAMFDLMYVNPDLAAGQYAFLRKAGKESVLVVVNFSGEPVKCKIQLPAHAFEVLGLKKRTVEAEDLLTAETSTFVISPDTQLSLQLPAYGGRVYKWK